jgi:hypothetical protein
MGSLRASYTARNVKADTTKRESGDLENWRSGDLEDLEILAFGDLGDLEIWRFGDLAI